MESINFFFDDSKQRDIDIDVVKFSELLSEYTGSYKHTRMVARMKEIYRDRTMLTDFLTRLSIDLKYLIVLTYHFDHKIITPQLSKELADSIEKSKTYPFWC